MCLSVVVAVAYGTTKVLIHIIYLQMITYYT